MTRKQKKNLRRIIIAICAFLIVKSVDLILEKSFGDEFSNGLASCIPNKYGWVLPFILYLIIYIYIGYDVLRKAIKNIINGQVFDENFLMSVATIGAFGLGIYTGVTTSKPEGFDEGCAVLLFYQVGEWFQSYAVGKSRKSISSLMDIRPDFARIKTDDGTYLEVDPSECEIGSIILVKAGERIPLDGVVISGCASIDTKALTGESLPCDVSVNDNVISGTINLNGTITIEVKKAYSESTVSKILDLVENASSLKSKSENFITKFSRVYTPIVVFLALAIAFLPPVFIGIIKGNFNTFSDWIYRALSFLVVSCPCALVISVPLSFFAGIGGASAKGILIKGSSYLEKFNKTNIFVFDKTGTLTKGNFAIKEVYPENNKEEVLKYASIAEKMSNHPIALSIKQAYEKEIPDEYMIKDVAGMGIVAQAHHTILCGNEKMMELYGVSYVKYNKPGSVVYVALDNNFLGYIVISDQIKDDAKETISYLNSIGAKTMMLTGDNESIASEVAQELKVSDYKASLLPQDKVEEVRKLMSSKSLNETLCFVGDGINDAPVLMASDIGLAMGGIGSDAAIEASDIVLMHDDLKSIISAKKIARKTMRIVFENIVFAIFVKVLILVLSALGITNMWFAVFGDVGVAVIAILNAMRTSKIDD